jgi:hypothetical protein
MKLHTSGIGTRIAGSALGIGFLAAGVFGLSMSGQAPNPVVGDRTFWLGATLTFAGVAAVAVSWLVADLSNIWCTPPRRFFRSK